jgi:hypothetical protein
MKDFVFLFGLTEYTVMAMAVSHDNALALTVSADHIIGRYDLTVG